MCDFPASTLLKMRRKLASQADASKDEAFVRQAAQFIMAVDELRLTHYDLENCPCWQDAIRMEAAA